MLSPIIPAMHSSIFDNLESEPPSPPPVAHVCANALLAFLSLSLSCLACVMTDTSTDTSFYGAHYQVIQRRFMHIADYHELAVNLRSFDVFPIRSGFPEQFHVFLEKAILSVNPFANLRMSHK